MRNTVVGRQAFRVPDQSHQRVGASRVAGEWITCKALVRAVAGGALLVGAIGVWWIGMLLLVG